MPNMDFSFNLTVSCTLIIKIVLVLTTVSFLHVTQCEETGEEANNNFIIDPNKWDTLQLVQVVFRHGDRNPTETFPTDPYRDEDTYWPDGFGELTQLGRQQAFELGVYLRQRYKGFMGDRYHKDDIVVISSDKDRTIMSAQAVLAGFYPPNTNKTINSEETDSHSHNWNWNPYIDWQLVPIHTISRQNDSFLNMKAPCPKFSQIFKDFYQNSDYVKNMEKEHKDLKDYLLANMGLPPDTTLMRLLTFQDTLMVQRRKNLEPPSWLDERTFKELNSIKYFQFKVETYTTDLKRFRGGPLIQKLMIAIVNKVNQLNSSTHESRRKMVMYSAHEGTLGALLNSLDLFNNVPPPYASAAIFELHSMPPESIAGTDNELNRYYVKILYRNDTKRDPYELEVPGCNSPCTVETLLSILKPVIPENWEEECQTSCSTASATATALKLSHRNGSDFNFRHATTTGWLIGGGLILIVTMTLLFTIISKYSSWTRRLNSKYETLP